MTRQKIPLNLDRSFRSTLYVLSSQLALEFVGSVVVGSFLGHLVDLRYDTHPFTLVFGGILGTMAGAWAAFCFFHRFFKKTDRK